MQRARWVVLAALTLGGLAPAAEITRVASSFEDKDPFGLYLDVAFVRTQELAKISREWHQAGSLTDVSELRYTGVDSRLQLDAHVGIYRDFEFHIGLPIVFGLSESWGYAKGTNASNSTITNNCLNPNGTLTDPSCPTTGVGKQAMFNVPGNSYRGGLGNMTFGLAYGIFNQSKDDTKPTWTVGFEYEAPTAAQLDPAVKTSSVDRGNIGDRVHKYTLQTSFSRKIGPIEPYFRVQYMIPAVGAGYYSNCNNPSNLGTPANCNTSAWSRLETGIKPASTGGVTVGTELNAYDQPTLHQKLAFDVRAIANYISAGRYYNELSGELGKLLASDQYLQLGGTVGVVAQAADYVAFKAMFSLLYNTDHTLTSEAPGRDLDHDGLVNVQPGSPEANPNFDYRTDLSSRRFILSEAVVFRIDISATFSF